MPQDLLVFPGEGKQLLAVSVPWDGKICQTQNVTTEVTSQSGTLQKCAGTEIMSEDQVEISELSSQFDYSIEVNSNESYMQAWITPICTLSFEESQLPLIPSTPNRDDEPLISIQIGVEISSALIEAPAGSKIEGS